MWASLLILSMCLIGLTVKKGNVHDSKHFVDTYQQVKGKLMLGSLVVFDKGAHSKENIGIVLADKMKYLTAKKLNKSDDKPYQRVR